MKKTVHVYVGTNIPMTTPTHPLSCAVAAKIFIDKIINLAESRFEIKTNSESSVRVLYHYGKHRGVTVKFFINGKKASLKEVIDDFNKAENYIDELMAIVMAESKGLEGGNLI